jgi:hypothetical protein
MLGGVRSEGGYSDRLGLTSAILSASFGGWGVAAFATPDQALGEVIGNSGNRLECCASDWLEQLAASSGTAGAKVSVRVLCRTEAAGLCRPCAFSGKSGGTSARNHRRTSPLDAE